MAELDDVRDRLKQKLGIGDRQLNRLIQAREGETLLPRRLAILLLASQNNISIRRHASEDDLSQLRAVRGGGGTTSTPSESVPVKRAASKATSSRKATTPRRVVKKASRPRPRAATRGRRVFVVHGRNDKIRKSLFSFLRALDLEPLEWRKAIAATGSASPMVADVLDAAFDEAVAVVVLLTPDDEVRLSPEFHKPSDPAYEKRVVGQARPNVLFEAGMAFGRAPHSTVLVQVGDVKPFSDVGGRHVTRLTNAPESRSELATKLRNAGCGVDDQGSDWYTEGDFTI